MTLTQLHDRLIAMRKEAYGKDEKLYWLIDDTLFYLEQLEEVKRIVRGK